MKYLSLFSGIGGFELGINYAYENYKTLRTNEEQKDSLNRGNKSLPTSQGNREDRNEYPTCIGYSEIDKCAIQVYQKHFPKHKNYGDTTKIDTKELPDFDLLCGGFPCQAFSIAGKRKGFEDTRGTLFFEIARIASEKRPRYLLLENVKGLLNHNKGKTFQTILGVLTDLGYGIEWQVLNSKHFGVPQNRERVFIIGCLGGTSRPKVFPIGESDKGDIKEYGKGKGVCYNSQARTLKARDYKGGGNLIQKVIDTGHQGNTVYNSKGISSTLNSGGGGQGGKTGLYYVASRGRNPNNPSDRTTGSPTKQRLEVNKQGTTNTLTNIQKDNWLTGGAKIRRLTPTECERLQGFPDGWTEGLSDTQRYKTLGNAVTVNVIRAIIKKLL